MSDHLDPALLRTFLEAMDAGGVMRAAARVGRTRAAVSLQMRRLQALVGRPLFRKVGRELKLTPTGEALAPWARRLLSLNEQALAALRGSSAPERVRLGAPQDVVERWLPSILSRLTAQHPEVTWELEVGPSRALSEGLASGRLDVSVRFSLGGETAGRALGGLRVGMFAARGFAWDGSAPLPLVVLDAPCVFRTCALEALDAAGLPWRIAASCPGLSAAWACVGAGLGVMVRAPIAVPPGVRPWQPRQLGPWPRATLVIQGGETGGEAVRALRKELVRELSARIARSRLPRKREGASRD